MNRPYHTKSIDQAAAIQAKTGIDPTIIFQETGIAIFEFPLTSDVTDVVLTYESGCQVDARAILTIRNQIFRRLKGGVK